MMHQNNELSVAMETIEPSSITLTNKPDGFPVVHVHLNGRTREFTGTLALSAIDTCRDALVIDDKQHKALTHEQYDRMAVWRNKQK